VAERPGDDGARYVLVCCEGRLNAFRILGETHIPALVVEGVVCLLDELWGAMFEPLKDEAMFGTAHHNDELGTVVWGNGADFAPEFLLELIRVQQRNAA
jgi:hypothetical protein